VGSAYSAWKTFERRFAKLMGGVRLWRPDYGDSAPDGESRTHTWDTKAYKRHAAVTLFVECEKKYRQFTGQRRFVLALFAREHSKAGDFVLVRAKDYVEDQKALGRIDNLALIKIRDDTGAYE
jgi:hypothetical protein